MDSKRQNFNVTPEQEAEINWLRDALGAASAKDAILRAVRITALLAREAQEGRGLYVGASKQDLRRVLIPELEPPAEGSWSYLVSRPHPWRRQLYVKGRRLLASTVWLDMQSKGMSPEEAAENWDLPRQAIDEILRYCEANAELLRMEAEEERRRLQEAGLALEPVAAG